MMVLFWLGPIRKRENMKVGKTVIRMRGRRVTDYWHPGKVARTGCGIQIHHQSVENRTKRR